jgi:hypothetical protein
MGCLLARISFVFDAAQLWRAATSEEKAARAGITAWADYFSSSWGYVGFPPSFDGSFLEGPGREFYRVVTAFFPGGGRAFFSSTGLRRISD